MKRETLFWDLTLKLEAFTHTVPVPFAVYYAIITQKMVEEHWRIFIFLCVFFAGAIGLFGTFLRHLLLKYLYARLDSLRIPNPEGPELSFEERQKAKSVKLFLFRYPLVEAIIIVIRWFAGVVPIVSLFTFMVGYMPSVVRSGIFTILMIPPISFVTYYFIAENSIRPLFDLPSLREIPVEPDEIPKFDYFKRILIAFFSLAALPVSVLSYILYSVAKGETAVPDPLVPIVIVSSIFIVPLVICSYVVAKTVKQGLNETNISLSELSNGNLNVTVSPKSSDDFAPQAIYLNSVIQKLRGMYAEIRTLNEGLEEKVKQRTFELNQTLTEVQTLKVTQDADYYLTYQLLSPLVHQEQSSSSIHLESWIEQKKKFEFRNQEYEIGGDVIITHRIHLKSKKYLLFVNADAMGKSMQGAGGALVFGAVFQSIVQRTKSNPLYQNLSPDLWLQTNMTEMHQIFETFDGTMLISLVMGLLEESTGKLYYVNAEHPSILLYRDGKSSFLTPSTTYRKLGTLGAKPTELVEEFVLKVGDILFLGSDGKDDILLPTKAGEWSISEDDALFSRLVEETDAVLPNLVNRLHQTGQFLDDLSLLRIHFLGEIQTTSEQFQKSEKTLAE